MKKMIFLALLICATFAGPELAKAEVVKVKTSVVQFKKDPPPILTYYCGRFDWGGGQGLPAGTYEVLSDLDGDHTTVLYIYDAYNNISYACYLSIMYFDNSEASIYVSGVSGGLIGFVSVY